MRFPNALSKFTLVNFVVFFRIVYEFCYTNFDRVRWNFSDPYQNFLTRTNFCQIFRFVPGPSAGGMAEELESDSVTFAELAFPREGSTEVVAPKDHGWCHLRSPQRGSLSIPGEERWEIWFIWVPKMGQRYKLIERGNFFSRKLEIYFNTLHYHWLTIYNK